MADDKLKWNGFTLDKINVLDAAKSLAELVQDPKKLRELETTKQNDYLALDPPLEIKGSVSKDLGSAGDVKFTLGGSVAAKYLVRAYNDANDKDADEIIEVKPANRTWLKHETSVAADGKLNGKLSDEVEFGIEGEASKSIRVLDYRRHPGSADAATSIVQNIRTARFPFIEADVGHLAEGDHVALVTRAKLGFKATLSFTDALTGSLGALDNALGVVGAGAFKVDIGAKLSFFVSATDDYKLVFSKGKSFATRVDVRKADGTKKGASGELGIKVGLEDPKKAASLIRTYLVGRLGTSWTKIKGLLTELSQAASFDGLEDKHKKVARAVAERLGFNDVKSQFDEFKKKVDGIEDKLQKRLETELGKKLEVKFTFSYTRIETEELLLSFELSRPKLEAHHRDLVLGNLSEVVEQLREGASGFKLIDYLQTIEVRDEYSFGVTFSLGSWAWGGSREHSIGMKKQLNIHDEMRLEFDGRYKTESGFTKTSDAYAFDLSAVMSDFSPRPVGADFQYGLGFNSKWEWKKKTLKGRDVYWSHILDEGNVWRVLAFSENQEVLKDLKQLPAGKVTSEIEVDIDDEGVFRLTEIPEQKVREAWIRAMAECLTPFFFQKFYAGLRANIADRRAIYGKAASWLFDQSGGADVILERQYGAAGYTGQQIDRLKAADDGKGLDSSKPYSLIELWHPRPGSGLPRQRCDELVAMLQKLGRLRRNQLALSNFKDIFDELFFRIEDERFQHRMVGSILVNLLIDDGRGRTVTRKLTVKPAEGDAIVIG